MTQQPARPSLAGRATADATSRFAARFPDAAPGHFRTVRDLTLSSIGIGTYLGEPTSAADSGYTEAVVEAVQHGCNVIDSAVNYRMQRSERSIAPALVRLQEAGYSREELLICTKGGFIPFDGGYPADPQGWIMDTLFRPGIISPEEIVAGCHCMTPGYLRNQLSASLENLGLSTVDVYYVHNPETQLSDISPGAFYTRLGQAFEALEAEVAAGRIAWYGTATWSGFRDEAGSPELMSLERVVQAARDAGGEDHHFRFVQLPVNLAMPEAFQLRNQEIAGRSMTLVEAAAELDVAVIASGSMLQGRLAHGLPDPVVSRLPDLADDAARAIQFARSVPGLTTALVGMGSPEHARDNLRLAQAPPLGSAEFAALFDAG